MATTAQPQTDSLRHWLDSLSRQGDNFLISMPRRFAHEEDNYDAHYGNEPLNFDVGHGAVQVYRDFGGDFSGPVIEIGCGTGLMSLGAAAAGEFSYLLLTDPSPKFLEITRKKIARANLTTDRVGYGVLMGEEISHLPRGLFSLVLLRSVLHHVIDVPAFIADVSNALKPGGMLIMEEPCQEGFIIMGNMMQFFTPVMEQKGIKLDAAQKKQVQLFIDTMKFYCRRDIDKSTAEDKHLFRVDELMKTGEKVGMTLDFMPNKTFYDWAPNARGKSVNHSFLHFFHSYLKYAMGFKDDLMTLFDAHFAKYCQWIEELALAGNGPYMHGVFVWKKKP